VAKELEIGENAQFYKDVTYWAEDGEIDFENLVRMMVDADLEEVKNNIQFQNLNKNKV